MTRATERQQWFLFLFLLGIGVISTTNLHLGWYKNVPLIDVPLHFLGGAWVALATLWFLKPKRKVLVVLLSVFTIGVLWEIFEITCYWLGNGVVRVNWFNKNKTPRFCFGGGVLPFFWEKKNCRAKIFSFLFFFT